MIVFDLKCAADHVFEAWFRDGDAYEAQVAGGEVVCPVCGDTSIAKAPMAPSLARRAHARESERPAQMMRYFRAVCDHVEKTFDDVGERFPEEARKIHYGETDKRSIYGQATTDEASELREEGIEFGYLPWVPRHHS